LRSVEGQWRVFLSLKRTPSGAERLCRHIPHGTFAAQPRRRAISSGELTGKPPRERAAFLRKGRSEGWPRRERGFPLYTMVSGEAPKLAHGNPSNYSELACRWTLMFVDDNVAFPGKQLLGKRGSSLCGGGKVTVRTQGARDPGIRRAGQMPRGGGSRSKGSGSGPAFDGWRRSGWNWSIVPRATRGTRTFIHGGKGDKRPREELRPTPTDRFERGITYGRKKLKGLGCGQRQPRYEFRHLKK